jgi:hypothetical protein
VRKYETGELNDETVYAVCVAEYEGKIAELERKGGQLTMEIDLLKKGRGWSRLAKSGYAALVTSRSSPGEVAGIRCPAAPRCHRGG